MDQAGGPEVLRYVERVLGEPPAGHVRVEVAAAGVNYADVYQRSGLYKTALPYFPGGEGSGRVVAVAPDVSEVSIGQRVAWQGVPGSYATEAIVPAWQLIAVPDGITDEHAAALLLQGLTAHYLATSSYAVQPGDTILIHAGAGGAGLLLTQVARLLGARVITTVSTRQKADLSRQAGAAVVATYEDFESMVKRETDGRGVAAVYDSVGLATFEGSLRSLTRRGTLVLFGQSSGRVPPFDLGRLSEFGSLTVTRPTLRDFVGSSDELQQRARDLFAWNRAGEVRVHIGRIYRLDDVASAHRDLEARSTTGKLLLRP
ncbi:quinone oxidoreductase [Kribbella sp. NPDC003505]|uniref:quinone oxidoreductase family protein n=1 Tax=Kribbella sp. NPDC003505 TaxID=3154448 RepID=UPI0033B03056